MGNDEAKVRRIEELDVFKLAHELTLNVYRSTSTFPRHETYGLVAQLRRAAASVPANLAEGAGRLNRREYRQFVGVARGSTSEAGYHILLAKDLGYYSPTQYEQLRQGYERIGQMLTRLAQALS